MEYTLLMMKTKLIKTYLSTIKYYLHVPYCRILEEGFYIFYQFAVIIEIRSTFLIKLK